MSQISTQNNYPFPSLDCAIIKTENSDGIKKVLVAFMEDLKRINSSILEEGLVEVKNKGTILGVQSSIYTNIYTRGKSIINSVKEDLEESRYSRAIYNSLMGIFSIVNGVNTVFAEMDRAVSGSSSVIKSALTGIALMSAPVVTAAALVINLAGMYTEMNMIEKEKEKIKAATANIAKAYHKLNEHLSVGQDDYIKIPDPEELRSLNSKIDKIIDRQDLNNFFSICSKIDLGKELIRYTNNKSKPSNVQTLK